MQPSMFNVRVPLEHECVFLLNTLSDAQAIVPQSIADLLDRLPGTDASQLTREQRQALRELGENGFIVEDGAREIEAVESYFRDVRESTDVLRVTVLTTLQCNFACEYCYQGDRGDWNRFAERMTLDTASRVADWIERGLEAVRPSTLSLMFFGGEPLLNLPVLYFLAERASAAARARGIAIRISIVTNGLLLTRELVERLLPHGLTGVKVTLDGNRATHDRMRPLRGGQGTFDHIVHNIEQVADICTVSIGGNFNEETIESYPELLRYLSRQKFAASIGQVSFKPIVERATSAIALTPVDGSGKPLNGTCMSVAGSGAANARDDCDFLDARMAWLHEETRRHGFSAPDGVHMGPCEIHRSHSHTIGPDGSLYPCPGFTGDRGKSIGHIDEASDPACGRTAAAFEELAAWKECHGCPFIPVCAGGCTVAAYAAFGDITKPNCHKRSFEAGVAALAREAAASAMSAPALAS